MTIPAGVLLLVAAVIVAAYFAPLVFRYALLRRMRIRLVRARAIALTYDDGPSSNFTPQILSLLASHRARATFFMLGQNALQNSAVADDVAQRGHEIGCHSDRHFNAWKVSPRKAIRDINEGYSNLRRWVSAKGIFRPPYGKMTLPTYWTVSRRGSRIWWWTVDSGDTWDPLPDPHNVVRDVVNAGGGIVLMHDLDRSASRNEFVLATTRLLLEAANTHGFKLCTVSELAE